MSLYIRNPETDRLARELAERTGLSLTESITQALRAELERTPERPRTAEDKLAFIRRLQAESGAARVLDPRAPDVLLCDDDGLPR